MTTRRGVQQPDLVRRPHGLPAYRAALSDMLGRYDELLPAVDPDDAEAVMPGSEPWSSCGPYAAADTSRRNEVTRGSLHTLMTLATVLHQQK